MYIKIKKVSIKNPAETSILEFDTEESSKDKEYFWIYQTLKYSPYKVTMGYKFNDSMYTYTIIEVKKEGTTFIVDRYYRAEYPKCPVTKVLEYKMVGSWTYYKILKGLYEKEMAITWISERSYIQFLQGYWRPFLLP